MNLRHGLILLTLVSVVADTMLLPYYPQFFEQVFAITDSRHTGYYVAACCLTVMLSLPVWARIARKVHEVPLWIITQLFAATLGLLCYFSTDIIYFWLFSQLMLMFKASYLLIYPFVMRLEEKDKHLGIIGLFAVLMHFGAIGGAIVGGAFIQWANIKQVFLIMVMTDLLQITVCLWLIQHLRIGFWQQEISETQKAINFDGRIIRLSLVSMLFYFSVFLISPFFTQYWQWRSELTSGLLSAFVYAIPAWLALICLLYQWFKPNQQIPAEHRIVLAIILGIAGVWLQSIDNGFAIIAGRVIYGWALYQTMTTLEVQMFTFSQPQNYGRDFSQLHLFQNIGVLLASLFVGELVARQGLILPFYVALSGLLFTLLCYFILFLNKASAPISQVPQAPQ